MSSTPEDLKHTSTTGDLQPTGENHRGATPEKQTISIVLPCVNEEESILELYSRLINVCDKLKQYDFVFQFVDNASTDSTVDKIKALADKDDRVKAILNSRNFGFARSPFYGMLQAEGDCVILLATDLQEPPELIPEFIDLWKSGMSVVVGQKTSSDEPIAMYFLRSLFYKTMGAMSEVPLLQHVTGFGLYDRRVIEIFKSLNEPIPYTRGLITEIGLPYTVVPYKQATRQKGKTKFNFFRLFDYAMLAVTSYAKAPMRVATFTGFVMSLLSFLGALCVIGIKLFYWKENVPVGYASGIVAMFFLASIQIFLLGLVGEYLLATMTYVRRRPLVVENGRVGKWQNNPLESSTSNALAGK